jgi:hypothetical protein
MSPSREDGIAETPHLVEQAFEETPAAPKTVLQGIVSARAS